METNERHNQQRTQRGDLEGHPVGGRADQQHLF